MKLIINYIAQFPVHFEIKNDESHIFIGLDGSCCDAFFKPCLGNGQRVILSVLRPLSLVSAFAALFCSFIAYFWTDWILTIWAWCGLITSITLEWCYIKYIRFIRNKQLKCILRRVREELSA